MSMRSQIYAWNSQTGTAWDGSATGQTGSSVSIFIGGFGNNITKPAETTATQFVVIEDVAVSPTAFLSTEGLVPGAAGSEGQQYRGLTASGPAAGGRCRDRCYGQPCIHSNQNQHNRLFP